MNRITFLSLALIMGFCLQPQPLFAQDQDQNKPDAKESGGSSKEGGENPKAGREVQKATKKEATPGGEGSHEKVSGEKSATSNRSTNPGTQDTRATEQIVQSSPRGKSQQKQSTTYAAVRGNQANQYNGQWVAASTHSDWDVNTSHEWNHHDYRYYDGGWLIIQTGPSLVSYESGSTGSNVQAALARQGYYHGPIDGEIGRGTRYAISHYEADNGLQVNGLIDPPLLASLGVQ